MSRLVWLIEPDENPILGFIFQNMAYPFMFIATGLMCIIYESLQNVIPGHPLLSFLVLACGAMVLTFLIMLLELIGPAFSAFCCMLMLCLVFGMIMNAIKPDTVQYFILLTVVFSVISLPLCFFNLTSGGGHVYIPGLSCIVAGILNALTAALYILIIRSAWGECSFPRDSIVIEDQILHDSILGDIFGGVPGGFASAPGAVVFYIVFAMICLGTFVATIICREKIKQLSKELAYAILQ